MLTAGLTKGRPFPPWITGIALVIGLGAMALTMGLPDRLALYQPIFHLLAFWLAATGVVLLRSGLGPASILACFDHCPRQRNVVMVGSA